MSAPREAGTVLEEASARAGQLRAHLDLLVTMAFFGSAFAASKVVVGRLPHEVAALLRFGGGALILLLVLAVLRGRNKGQKLTRSQVLRAAGVGLLGVFAYNLFFFWGLSLAPSIDGSVIVPVFSPVITTAILLSVRAEAVSVARVAGLAVGLAGAVVFLLGAGGFELGGSRLAGDLLYLLGAVAWALYSIASKKVLKGIDPMRATTLGTLAGAGALLLFALPALPRVDWSGVPTGTWAVVAFLAIGPTAVAYVFYYRGLRVVSPSTATVMMFTVPLFGVTCAVVFLGERFTAVQLVGALVMLAGALLAVVRIGGRRAARAAAGGAALH